MEQAHGTKHSPCACEAWLDQIAAIRQHAMRRPLGGDGDGSRCFTREALEKMFAQGLLRTPDSASVLQRASDEIIRRRH